MTNKCVVPNCNSGREIGDKPIAFFNVPTNDELRKKWTDAIPQKCGPLYRTDLVCEKHFFESDIIRHYIVQDTAGNVVQKVAYDQPRLADTAIPSIFIGFELRLNQPETENGPEPTTGQNASDVTSNYKLSGTATDTVANSVARDNNIIPEVKAHPPGWIIPEVTKHSQDWKVNEPAVTGNYDPAKQLLMGRKTSNDDPNPMNGDIQGDAKNKKEYESRDGYRNQDPVITGEPIPVTFHPTTVASLPHDKDDSECCQKCESCLGFCFLSVQCLELMVHCIGCCIEICAR